MSNQTDHTIVRLRVPPELKKQIEESAEHNNRSQSAEMVARLEKSFSEIDTNFRIVSKEVVVKVSEDVFERIIKILKDNNENMVTLSESTGLNKAP